MKKLLLGMTIALITLTATLYAACTQDVEMGGNKIKALGNGTNDGDAVNYAQTLKVTEVDVPENNASIIKSFNESTQNVRVSKTGNLCMLTGDVINVSGATLSTSIQFGTIPTTFRPIRDIGLNPEFTDINRYTLGVSSSGVITLWAENMSSNWVNNGYIPVSVTYICN